jgi:Doubled CXXCH motif (Paired_CXXCH_1)/Cytochrome c554 and c-prime
VGAAVCSQCHGAEYQKWSHARHGKMLQPATASSVEGNFTTRAVTLRGLTYRLRAEDGAYYITESYLSGKEQEHRVDYTLGSRRIQHYLTTLPDGRIIVLPPSWDVLRKQWFHNLEIVNPEESDRVLLQVWNRSCYGCHVSREEKGFDPEHLTYTTRWTDFGTNCERCHGPGSEHVNRYQHAAAVRNADTAIVLQTRLSPLRNTMVCAQCHSLRNVIGDDFTAGSNYYDSFFPILEYAQKVDPDPAYWADGRPRRFSNDAIGFWESQCFLKGGATCISCHEDVHDPEVEKNPKLRPGANALCMQCHQSIGKAISAHTHHAPGSAGSSCVECHMPRTVISIRAAIRDHTISIPRPENTVRYQIPNACNTCHLDKDAPWAVSLVNAWYGRRPISKEVRRAEAFTRARNGDRGSIELLLAILADRDEGFVIRANAAGHMSRFSDDPRVRMALERALTDAEPLVRGVAALRLLPGPADPREVASAFAKALADPVRTIRFGATLSLLNMGISRINGPDHDRFEQAKQEAAAHYGVVTDDADEEINAGRFYYLAGDPDRALAAFRTAVKLDPRRSVSYFMANVFVQKGDLGAARKILQQVSSGDPYYSDAQKLLQTLPAVIQAR